MDYPPREGTSEPARKGHFHFKQEVKTILQDSQPVALSPSPKKELASVRSPGAHSLRGELSLRSVVDISADPPVSEAEGGRAAEEDASNTVNMERVLEELKSPDNEN